MTAPTIAPIDTSPRRRCWRQASIAVLSTAILAITAVPVLADQPSDPKKDKRESTKAVLKLQRAVSEKCDRKTQTRGPDYQAVMKEINVYCGRDIASGCSVSGSGQSFVLQKLTDKKLRISSDSKRYPSDFARVLTKHCKD